MNPYLNRLMIKDPAQFFGRSRELSYILNRIGAEPPQSVSVVGDRRMGKSSLLYRLTFQDVQRQYIVDHPALPIVFLDFQQLRDISLNDFFALILPQIKAIQPSLRGLDEPGYAGFQAALDQLHQEKCRLVMLFDEFDVVTSNPLFTKEFYSFLRSAANHYSVAYVTSSKTELQKLCYSAEIADSPFFNIFSNLYLKPFSKEEAHELIRVPSERAGANLDPYADHILDIAGRIPFYLQIACCAYFDWITENPGKAPDKEEVEARFMEEAAPHYDYLLEHLNDGEIKALDDLVTGKRPGPETLFVCQKLTRDGYLALESGNYRIASRLFAEHLKAALSSADRRTAGATRVFRPQLSLGPGTTLQQYELRKKIGEGGMGAVYQGTDTLLKRNVAVKVIRQDAIDAEGSRKRFLQEARLSASLTHPAITSVYELLDLGDQVAIVMEWLEGQTVKEKVVKGGPIEWKTVVKWMIEACDGLQAAFRQGIIHRDIKSANLFITVDDRLKILDLGLAKIMESVGANPWSSQLTTEGALLGTVDYMSPEQACGQSADHRADLFSLGVVMYESLTGRLPFRRNSVPATLHAIVNDPPTDLDLFRVKIDENLERIIQRLLEKQPSKRYQTPVQVQRDLQDLLRPRRKFFDWFR